MYVYVYGSLTLSILTITQRHGDDGVVSSKCSVGNGRVKTFRFASELWQFRLPRLASVFRMRH